MFIYVVTARRGCALPHSRRTLVVTRRGRGRFPLLPGIDEDIYICIYMYIYRERASERERAIVVTRRGRGRFPLLSGIDEILQHIIDR